MLSDRRQRILRALIEEYVSHAMPVGSKTIAEQYHLGVSSATVRNELSALEEAGYIMQPHTSAGRIPTDAGYREFVDDLLASEAYQSNVRDDMAARMRASADALDGLMRQVSEELARLTDCLSIVGCMDADGAPSQAPLAKKERLGLSSLMRKPEFQESSSLLPLMEILEDDTVYFKAFDEASSATDGFAVRIGRENEDSSLVCVSVVAGVYGYGDSRGVVAVIGPRRMDYGNVIGAVRAAQSILNME